MPGDKKLTGIKLFEHFKDALADVQTYDSVVSTWQKPKIPFCMRLACHLQRRFPGLFVDLQPNPGNLAVPLCDILVHSREEEDYRPLAIICGPSYLNNSDQSRLAALSRNPDTLVLGVAILPQKDYYLIYQATPGKLEYHHYDKTRLECEPLRKKEVDSGAESPQLLLNFGARKRKWRKKENKDGIHKS